MSKPIAPCRECKDRDIGCHGYCEKYLDFCEKNEKHRQERYKLNRQRYEAGAYISASIKRNKKKK